MRSQRGDGRGDSLGCECIAWIERYLANGGTLLLCSHSMYHVQKLCGRALWLKEGRVERYGSSAEVTQSYLAYHEEKSAGAKQPIAASRAAAAGVYAIQSLSLDPEAQLLEDVVCLVFLENYFAEFAREHDEAKLIEIVRKTWKKMSDRGHQAALTLPLSDDCRRIVEKALT